MKEMMKHIGEYETPSRYERMIGECGPTYSGVFYEPLNPVIKISGTMALLHKFNTVWASIPGADKGSGQFAYAVLFACIWYFLGATWALVFAGLSLWLALMALIIYFILRGHKIEVGDIQEKDHKRGSLLDEEKNEGRSQGWEWHMLPESGGQEADK